MRLPITCAVVATSVLLGCGPAFSADHLIRDVHVVDVETGVVKEDQDILLRDGVIAQVGDAPVDAPGAEVLEGSGGYVIPGLWDSHVHVFSSLAEPGAAFPLYILNGITSIRDMGGLLPLDEIKRIATAVEAGELMGPRIVLSGAWVDASPGSWPGMFLADTPAQASAVVRKDSARRLGSGEVVFDAARERLSRSGVGGRSARTSARRSHSRNGDFPPLRYAQVTMPWSTLDGSPRRAPPKRRR